MKSIAIAIVRGLNRLHLLLFSRSVLDARGSKFAFASIRSDQENCLSLRGSEFHRTHIRVEGRGNVLAVVGSAVSGIDILIRGRGNHVSIEDGVELNDTKIVVRGDECSVVIGRNTTFAGGRIVSVGNGCAIRIGEDCMISDQVEIWASDTHPIYDQTGVIINAERPVTIGDRVWVGSRAVLLKGVTVGNGSVIGMSSVVTSDVPERSISAGHPSRTIKTDIDWSKYYPPDDIACRKS